MNYSLVLDFLSNQEVRKCRTLIMQVFVTRVLLRIFGYSEDQSTRICHVVAGTAVHSHRHDVAWS